MTVKIHSKLKSQHKAREWVATLTVLYYGLSIHTVFHGQDAPGGRWFDKSDCLTRKIFGPCFSYTIRGKNSSTQNWIVTPCIEGMQLQQECFGVVILGNSSSLCSVTCTQLCSSLPGPALVPLAVGILSKRTNLSTHSSRAVGWPRIRGACVWYSLSSTFLEMLLLSFSLL